MPLRSRLAGQPASFSLIPSTSTLPIMRSFFTLLVTLALASVALAQSANLTADNAQLSGSGGQVTLTASASYDGTPGAIGWAIKLPPDWSLASVAGPNVPAIAPAAGSTGTLEFAYSSVPAGQSAFSVVVNYPAGATATQAAATVLIRINGKLTTLSPAPVELKAK